MDRQEELFYDQLKEKLDEELSDIQVSEDLIASTLNKIKQSEDKTNEQVTKHKHPWYRSTAIKITGGLAAACFLLYIGSSFIGNRKESYDMKSENMAMDIKESMGGTITGDSESMYPSSSQNNVIMSDCAKEEQIQASLTDSQRGETQVAVYDCQENSEKATQMMQLVPSDYVLLAEKDDAIEGIDDLKYHVTIMNGEQKLMDYMIYGEGIIEVLAFDTEEPLKVLYQTKNKEDFFELVEAILEN